MSTRRFLGLVATLVAMAGAVSAAPAPGATAAIQRFEGDAVLQTDESGRWLIVTLDPFDGSGVPLGHVDKAFAFELSSPIQAVPPTRIASARIELGAGALRVVSPRERQVFQMVLRGASPRPESARLQPTVYRDGLQLKTMSGAFLGSQGLGSFDIQTLHLEPQGQRPNRGGGSNAFQQDPNPPGGGGSCASSCSPSCSGGNCSVDCTGDGKCASCSCDGDGNPSCACS